MKHARRQQGKGAFDLIEEAVHLLRTAPVAAIAIYYLGAIPFVLALLFFWADMSRNPFANQHLADASLAMAASFLWMKFWQAIFARRIRAQLSVEPPPPLNFRRCLRIFLTQTILQPFGLFLIPCALVLTVPFAWVHAFFQNATALAHDEGSVHKLFKKSCKQAALWPMQNNLALCILSAFALYVFLNWATVCLLLPQLLKTLYTLRCFYGDSLQSGEDLKAELKPFVSLQKIAAVIFILAAILSAAPAKAANNSPPAQNASQVSPPALDKAIDQTIHESKYVWRMPREKIQDADANEGIIAKFFDKIGAMLRKWTRAFFNWLNDWLRKWLRHRPTVSAADNSGYGWIESVQLLLWTLVAVAAAALAIFLYRVWRGRQKSRTIVASEAIFPTPDISDENIGADQLPEDGWMKLARELLERGEFRLAMRAFYLASLSHLAARNLISIARFKSNRDYERELRRRAHAFPDLLSIFDDNLSVFERIWYGMHEVNPDLVNRFSDNVEKIKAG